MKKFLFILMATLLFGNQSFSQIVAAYKWSGSLSGTGNEYPECMKTDQSGNVLLSGRFDGTIDLNPGSGYTSKTAAGSSDCFLIKLNSSGSYQWGLTFGGTGTDRINSHSIDAAGNIIVTGYFSSTVDFDPGTTTNSITAVSGTDFFISKFDANGNYLWTKTFGDLNTDYAYGVATDASNNIYVSGEFSSDSLDMDPGAGTFMVYNSVFASYQFEGYLLKLDSSGAFQWCNTMKGAASDYARSIVITPSQDVIIGGYYNTAINLDPAGQVVSNGLADCYLAKFDNAGNFGWLRTFGGAGTDNLLALDVRGYHLIATGTFNNIVDFDPSIDTLNLISNGSTDIFLLELDAVDGTLNWANRFGSNLADLVASIAIHPNGNIYVSGSFIDSTNLDPSGNAAIIHSVDQRDGFIAKYDSTGGYIFGHRVGSVGIDYGRCIAADPSIDEFWTAGYFNAGNFYPDPNSSSTIFPNIGANDAFICKYGSCSFPVINAQPVNTGTCPGGNASFVVNATGSNLTYQWQIGLNFGSVWSNLLDTGIYSNTTTSTLVLTGAGTNVNNSFYRCIISADCGLSTTTNVSIMFASATNISVNQNQYILQAVQSNAVYRWLDCNNGYSPIPFATTQQYIPSQPGSYAVEITFNGCTDTSACYTVATIGIDEITNDQLSVYPVPASSFIHIEMKDAGHYTAKIYDLNGRRVMNNEETTFDQYTKIDLSSLEPGTYLLGVTSADGKETHSTIIRQ